MNEQRQNDLFAVAVYKGHSLTPFDLPHELWSWTVIDGWFRAQGLTELQRTAIKRILESGEAHKCTTPAPANIPVTLYGVVEDGRAINDIRRAKLLAAKTSNALH